ncbi:MAG: aminopeptidase, partial [Acidobacteriaceae bacterium]|nr:aminopeptidase [Acidobacteriaceae bacterium]
MSTDLKSIDFDPELREGAHNAVYVCLKVQPSEKVTVITDQASEEIAASLVAELEDCDCTYHTFV